MNSSGYQSIPLILKSRGSDPDLKIILPSNNLEGAYYSLPTVMQEAGLGVA